jgi:hypothetical protein
MQEYFEEIKLPEQLNVVIKEPKQIYWFRATKDKAKNKALFDKLCDLVGSDKYCIGVSDGIIYFNPSKNIITYCVENHINSSIECTIAMMIGKEQTFGRNHYTGTEVAKIDNGILQAATVGIIQLLGGKRQA